MNNINHKCPISALSFAIIQNNIEQAQILVHNGSRSYFDSNAEQKDYSPIFLACEIENSDMIEIMCDHGESLENRNS